MDHMGDIEAEDEPDQAGESNRVRESHDAGIAGRHVAASSGAVSPGPASSGAVSPGPASSGPVSSGPVSPGPVSPGPASSDSGASGPAVSGSAASGLTSFGSMTPGSASSDLAGSGLAATGPATTGPASSGSGSAECATPAQSSPGDAPANASSDAPAMGGTGQSITSGRSRTGPKGVARVRVRAVLSEVRLGQLRAVRAQLEQLRSAQLRLAQSPEEIHESVDRVLRRPSAVEARLRGPGRRLLARGRAVGGMLADEMYWLVWQAQTLSGRVRRERGRRLARGDASLPLVVAIPGLATKWDFLLPMLNAVNEAGYRIASPPGLGRVFGKSRTYAVRVCRWLESHSEFGDVVLLGHSKGGLIAKHVLLAEAARQDADADAGDGGARDRGARDRGVQVLGAVTVSTPFSGALQAQLIPDALARLPVAEAAIELRPGSQEQRELESQTGVDARLVSVSPLVDEVVGVPGVLLAGRNRRVGELGHNRLLASRRVHRVVLQELAAFGDES